MDKRTENLIEISWVVGAYLTDENVSDALSDMPSKEIKECISDWADEFEGEYSGVDWDVLAYYEEIEKFANKRFALELWHAFGDVPMDPETECIEEKWAGFEPGTFREDIWHWFEDTFNVSVAEDLMGL